jgi:DnaJ like chaperone protein
MEYLLNLAFIDHQFTDTEYMITEDIANALEIKPNDFKNLIEQFRSFYTNIQNNKANDLDEAYKILGVSKDDDFATIKKQYRKLVKQNHPDIVTGQGASKSIIEEATAKLQQINEAYELIKKEKNY